MEIWRWVEDPYVSLSEILDAFDVGNVLELLADLGEGFHDITLGNNYYWVKLSITSLLSFGKDVWTHIRDEIERGPFTDTESYTLQIPGDLSTLWDTSEYGLFWHVVGDLLQLVFDYLIEQFMNIVDSIMWLLEQIGIFIWDLLSNILKWLNKAKADEIKSLIREKGEDYYDDVLEEAIIEDISVPESINIAQYFSTDSISQEINNFFPSTNFFDTPEEQFDQIIGFLNLLGISLTIDDFSTIVDDIYDTIEDEYNFGDIPSFQTDINIDEVLSQISGITSGWVDFDDVLFSDIDKIIELIINIDDIISFLRDASELSKTIKYYLNLFNVAEIVLEYIIDFIAKTDFYMYTRPNYDILMIGIFIWLGIDYVVGFFDNLKDVQLPKYFVEVFKIVTALGVGIYGKLAYRETDSDNKKLVANFYFKLGAGRILPFVIELALNTFLEDKYAEMIKSVFKIALYVFGFLPTIFYFEPLGWWLQTLWSICTLVYGGSRATWGIIGKIGGKPYYIIAGIGLGALVHMMIQTVYTPSH